MDLERTDTIDMNSYIDDNRTEVNFKTNTFSKFNKNEVKKTFLSELTKGRIENACYTDTRSESSLSERSG